jgi:hypothetical protein
LERELASWTQELRSALSEEAPTRDWAKVEKAIACIVAASDRHREPADG